MPDGEGGKQLFYHRKKIGRAQCLPLPVHSGTGKEQMIRGLCQIHVQIKALHIHLLSGRWGKLQAASLQKLPVHVRQQTTALRRPRNISVVDADEKQSLHPGQPCSLHIPGHHPVHVLWNSSHLNLRKSGIQNLIELFHFHRFLSEKLHDLIQKIHHQPVNLAVFHGAHHILLFLKAVLVFLQLLLHPVFFNEGIKSPHQLLHLHKTSHQRGKLSHEPFPHPVQTLQFLHCILHVLRSGGENIAPFFLSPYAAGQHIVFQLVHFLPGKIGESASEIMKHRLIAEILRHDLQGAFYVFQKGIQNDSTGPVQIKRDAIKSCHGLQIVRIRGQIPRDHRHIPVTAAGAAQIFPDGNADLPHLLPLAGRFKKGD